MTLREPEHNDVQPAKPTTRVDRRLTEAATRLRRWRATALVAALLLIASVGLLAADNGSRLEPTASAAAAVKATDQPDTTGQYTDQAKAEIALLRAALQAASKVTEHHRHHSEIMWKLLAGEITPKEAWWQGGDSTCAGWVAAGEYEQAVAKLKGKEVTPPPVPKEGLGFCKQARERK